MGMKVAAVSVLCQDRRVYDAMEMAGTPCPFLGKIGDQATDEWKANPDRIPPVEEIETKNDVQNRNAKVGATIGGTLLCSYSYSNAQVANTTTDFTKLVTSSY